jgi:hypothetical protein
MKKFILLLFLIQAVFLSCSNKNKTHLSRSNAQLSSSQKKTHDFGRFHEFIDGVWVSTAYIESLKKSASPYNSKKYLEGIASLTISTKAMIAEGDSTVIGVSLNNHEGGEITLYYKPGQKINSIRTNYTDSENTAANFYELGYNINSGDTSLIIYHYSKEKRLIDSARYSRVTKTLTNDDMGEGIQFITNKILITGTYLMKDDSTKNTRSVRFTNNSKVKGFDNYSTCYINTDFVAGPAPKFDTIDFSIERNTTDQPLSYAFRVKGDTIKLFKVIAEQDSTEFRIGGLAYLLVKQKK